MGEKAKSYNFIINVNKNYYPFNENALTGSCDWIS
jgi:hypothetical protein